MLHELLVKLALARELQHEEDTFLVMEVSVQSEDVWVSQVLLDLNLATNLLFDARLDNLGFVEALEADDVMRFRLGAHHVHMAELALA